jgi:hypothetical protein
MRSFNVCVPALFVFQLFLFSTTHAIKGSDLDINGYIGFEVGQMVRSQYQGFDYNHLWLGSSVGNINFKAVPNENLTVLLGMEGRIWFNSFPPEAIRNQHFVYDSYTDLIVHQAQGILSLKKSNSISLECAAGIMPYKYNSEARNLGEYLFRTGTFPAYIINSFDFPRARLSGARVSCNYTGSGAVNAGIDVFVLTERQMRPFHDLSLAAIANVEISKAVTLGAGIELAHIWAVEDTMTTSKRDDNKYINGTDTGFYSFGGTKLMARVIIDPLFSLRENLRDIVGNGGKIYGECAILGLENYPADPSTNKYGYNELKNKMPLMFGINLPGWKILDICALEFEYFGCRYPDSYDQVIYYGYPLPATRFIYSDSTIYQHDNWKWSVYLKKNIARNFGLIFQVGRDHMRYEAQGAFIENADFGAALVKAKQFAWRSKFEFTF